MNKETFILELDKLGIKLNDTQLNQLHIYYEMLVEWNKVMNLTGITDEEQVYLKHFYDSLTIYKVIDLKKETSLCDVGTGAGFPGLVLKICFPNLKVVLVDALEKRLKFINAVIDKLELNNIETVHARAEDYARTNREMYDVVTARAVAPLNVLIEYCLPLIKPKKYFVAMKGNISQELETLPRALTKIDGKLIKNESFVLPFEESNRSIVVISKLGNTSNKFPRKYSDIKNKPL